jgi:hypothetical protein
MATTVSLTLSRRVPLSKVVHTLMSSAYSLMTQLNNHLRVDNYDSHPARGFSNRTAAGLIM